MYDFRRYLHNEVTYTSEDYINVKCNEIWKNREIQATSNNAEI